MADTFNYYTLEGLIEMTTNKYRFIGDEKALAALSQYIEDAEQDHFEGDFASNLQKARNTFAFLTTVSREGLSTRLSNIVYYREDGGSGVEHIRDFIDACNNLNTYALNKTHLFPLALEAYCKLEPAIYQEGGAEFFHKQLNSLYGHLSYLRDNLRISRDDITAEKYTGVIPQIDAVVRMAGKFGDLDVLKLLEEARSWGESRGEQKLERLINASFEDAVIEIRQRLDMDDELDVPSETTSFE